MTSNLPRRAVISKIVPLMTGAFNGSRDPAVIWEQNPTQHHIVNALAALPVLVELPAMVAKGSADLLLPHRPSRAIAPHRDN